MVEQISNNPLSPTTLASNITSTSATTLSVTSGAGYPATGSFRIQIDSELMEVTGVSGTTWTITRGAESSTAATHSSGATVNIVITAAGVSQILADHISEGTYASVPSVAGLGRLYLPTDSFIVQHDNGSSLSHWGPFPNYSDPTGISFTHLGNMTPTLTQSKGICHFDSGTISGTQNDNWSLWELASYPSTPWSIDAGFIMDGPGVNYHCAGLYIRDSSNKMVTAQFIHNSGLGLPEAWVILAGKWNSGTSYSTNYANALSTPLFPGWVIRFKIRDDGTNITFSYSVDFGLTWRQLTQQGRTNFTSTPVGCGFGWNPNCQTSQPPYGLGCNLIHWVQGT